MELVLVGLLIAAILSMMEAVVTDNPTFAFVSVLALAVAGVLYLLAGGVA